MLRSLCAFGLVAEAESQYTEGDEIRLSLGGLFPLTGGECIEGIGALFGARMAVKAVNGADETMSDVQDNKWKQWGADCVETTTGNLGTGVAKPFHLNVTLAEADSKASKSQALFETDKFIHSGVNSIIGPLTSEVTESVALLAKYDQLPVVSYSSPMPKLTSADMGLDTFIRTFPSDKAVIKAAVDLIHHIGWEGVTLITTNDENGVDAAHEFNYWTSEAASELTAEDHQHLVHKNTVYMDDDMGAIYNKLKEVKDGKWRIVILHASGPMAMKIMHVAKTMRMVKMGWVWIGTQWATDPAFLHCVWPQGWDGSESTEGSCANMTGAAQSDKFCEQGSCVEKISLDGTASYMRKDSDNDELIDMEGLVAIRVQPQSSDTSVALEALWDQKKSALIDEFRSQCPMIENEEHMHRLAYYAFDAVLSAAKGASELYKCGSVQDGGQTDCGSISTAEIDRLTAVMNCEDSANTETCTFKTNTPDMFDRIQDVDFEDGASGDVAFVRRVEHQISGEMSGGGDPSSTIMEIVNYKASDGEFGEFVTVGTWTQKRDQDCSHGHCGILDLPPDTIVWMGGSKNVPSDRVVDHDAAEAQYFLLVLCALILSVWGGSILELMHFHYIPEAGLTCIVGMGVGILIKLHVHVTKSHHFEELAFFDEGVFALVLLPIIIFDAGFGAKKARFFGNIGPIMTCALLGTTLSTFIVGIGMKLLGDSGLSDVELGWFESFTFGALISAVDPVATLAVFGALKVETNLNYCVFGESIINDAVSIVWFRVFGKYMVEPWAGAASMGSAFVLFMKIGLGSVLVGVIVALVASFVLKISHIHDPLLACGVFIFSSYCAYELTEAMHLSGIIASLFAGFCMRNYALENIMEQYQEMVLDMVHMLAQMSDLVIFFMVGENVILYMPYDKWWMIFWTIILCQVGRLCNVFPLCSLYNCTQSIEKVSVTLEACDDDVDEKLLTLQVDDANIVGFTGMTVGRGKPKGLTLGGAKITEVDGDEMTPETMLRTVLGYQCITVDGNEPTEDGFGDLADLVKDKSVTLELQMDKRVSFKNQIVMFHAGLRGAIAFALALIFPSQHRKYVIDTTTWVILFSVFVMGGTTVPLLHSLNIPLGCPDDPAELKFIDGALLRQKAKSGQIKKGMIFRLLEFEAALKRFITRSPEEELGVFALPWDEMEPEQQDAALVLGYSNNDDQGKPET